LHYLFPKWYQGYTSPIKFDTVWVWAHNGWHTVVLYISPWWHQVRGTSSQHRPFTRLDSSLPEVVGSSTLNPWTASLQNQLWSPSLSPNQREKYHSKFQQKGRARSSDSPRGLNSAHACPKSLHRHKGKPWVRAEYNNYSHVCTSATLPNFRALPTTSCNCNSNSSSTWPENRSCGLAWSEMIAVPIQQLNLTAELNQCPLQAAAPLELRTKAQPGKEPKSKFCPPKVIISWPIQHHRSENKKETRKYLPNNQKTINKLSAESPCLSVST
jgi:hypothetical protein